MVDVMVNSVGVDNMVDVHNMVNVDNMVGVGNMLMASSDFMSVLCDSSGMVLSGMVLSVSSGVELSPSLGVVLSVSSGKSLSVRSSSDGSSSGSDPLHVSSSLGLGELGESSLSGGSSDSPLLENVLSLGLGQLLKSASAIGSSLSISVSSGSSSLQVSSSLSLGELGESSLSGGSFSVSLGNPGISLSRGEFGELLGDSGLSISSMLGNDSLSVSSDSSSLVVTSSLDLGELGDSGLSFDSSGVSLGNPDISLSGSEFGELLSDSGLSGSSPLGNSGLSGVSLGNPEISLSGSVFGEFLSDSGGSVGSPTGNSGFCCDLLAILVSVGQDRSPGNSHVGGDGDSLRSLGTSNNLGLSDGLEAGGQAEDFSESGECLNLSRADRQFPGESEGVDVGEVLA